MSILTTKISSTVISQGKQGSKALHKVLMLLGIYSLHLIFFQAMLAAPAYDTANAQFKSLFVSHHQLPVKSSRTAHPAATYYAMMIKQNLLQSRKSCETAASVQVANATTVSIPHQFVSSLNSPVSATHPSGESVQRYLAIRVMRI